MSEAKQEMKTIVLLTIVLIDDVKVAHESCSENNSCVLMAKVWSHHVEYSKFIITADIDTTL